jgi:hypothetical protein
MKKHSLLSLIIAMSLILILNVGTSLAQTDATDSVGSVNTEFAPLKICNIAGPGVAVGTPSTFTITTLVGETAESQQLYTTTLTVVAGPAAAPGTTQQNGFCDFAAGPITDSNGVVGGALINGIGSFQVGSMVTVQETTVNGITTVVSSPTSPFSNGITAGIGILNIMREFNEVQFFNMSSIPISIHVDRFRKHIRFYQ